MLKCSFKGQWVYTVNRRKAKKLIPVEETLCDTPAKDSCFLPFLSGS